MFQEVCGSGFVESMKYSNNGVNSGSELLIKAVCDLVTELLFTNSTLQNINSINNSNKCLFIYIYTKNNILSLIFNCKP